MGGPDGEMGLGGGVSLRHLTTRCHPIGIVTMSSPLPDRAASPGGPPGRDGLRCGAGVGRPGMPLDRAGMAIFRIPKRPHGSPHD